MSDVTLFILLAALVLDWFLGEPKALWTRFPHPVVLFGRAVTFADNRLNKSDDVDTRQYKSGAVAITLLVLLALLAAFVIQYGLAFGGVFGVLGEVLIVFVFLAQKSLADHVGAVATRLRKDGLEGGQSAVSLIVGRDPDLLDRSGTCRAAIESLAENFSDGVVAPALWYAVFGLPGLFVYKMINTADSMIGHRSQKYLHFGRAAAQIDDLANWLPARMSAFLIAAGAGLLNGPASARHALGVAFRDAGLHRSPNAGWPEAAMAGGVDIALGGPRVYANETVEQAWLNSSGRHALGATDVEAALQVFSRSCFVGWGLVALLALVV